MFNDAMSAIASAEKISVIQAENPDGDSLGSALSLESLLGEQGKQVSLYCPVAIPKYLRYVDGWDRITDSFDYEADLYIIVDTSSKTLLEKALTPENLAQLSKKPVIVIDHHTTESDLPFDYTALIDKTISASEIVFKLAVEAEWDITADTANLILSGILSDSLGMTSEAMKLEDFEIVTELVRLGASVSTIEIERRKFMKKSPDILAYKGRLLDRIEYFLEGQLALVHIPWEEIEQYSDAYNPSALVIDEMRLVEGVKLAVALKTYPDGKLTGKLRANPEAKIAETVAGYFGGGGHPYAAGFRVYETYDKIVQELLEAVDKALKDYETS